MWAKRIGKHKRCGERLKSEKICSLRLYLLFAGQLNLHCTELNNKKVQFTVNY